MGEMWTQENLKEGLAADKVGAVPVAKPVAAVAKKVVASEQPALRASVEKMSELRTGGFTAAEVLKSSWPRFPNRGGLRTAINSWCEDKAFDRREVATLCGRGIWGPMVGLFFMKSSSAGPTVHYDSLGVECEGTGEFAPYVGTPQQDLRVKRAASGNETAQNAHGSGASTSFSLSPNSFPLGDIKDVPIAIIGRGAAGIMAAAALNNLGFTKIKAFEKSEDDLGAWKNENVSGRSRNNPRNLNYLGRSLNAAPGEGIEVRNFLADLTRGQLNANHAEVVKVIPGELDHDLVGRSGPIGRFPIVINCAGLGKPAPLSNPKKMTVGTGLAANRWQRNLKAEDVKGKRFLLVGLGNSTAEMLRQIHVYQDLGVEVDYRVLTHYSRDSVMNPDVRVKGSRVFRDTSVPNLVDFQGDLSASRYDYFRALTSGRIVPEVTHYGDVARGHLVYHSRGVESIKYDDLYALTGYKHSKESLEAMGISVDLNGSPRYDYDGEFQRPGRFIENRTFKGYFGLGAVLDAPHNRNSVVIPGMIAQMGDLLTTLVVRAAEYVRRTR